MTTGPSPTGDNGRDERGRFGSGNRFAVGNPHAKRVAALRSAVLKAVKPSRLRRVITALLDHAEAGDVAAAKLVLDRTLGPAVEADLIERLERLETALEALHGERRPETAYRTA